jgi:hypothetical protein
VVDDRVVKERVGTACVADRQQLNNKMNTKIQLILRFNYYCATQ